LQLKTLNIINTDCQLLETNLDLGTCINFIRNDDAGGEVIFIGTVRNMTKGKTVLRLEFEAYQPMALREMQKIASEAISRFQVHRISLHHRIGVLCVGEIPVIIAVSSAHRGVAFEACQYCIDTLKETVPIWKKEFFEDGAIWVAAHP
jgi:molybdopterin synthase catalytic subunit